MNSVVIQQITLVHQKACSQQMKQDFYTANIGNEFPVLWEGYNESYSENKQLAFGYTPNYLRIGCLIDLDQSIENKTLTVKLTASTDEYVFGELVGNQRTHA